MSAEYRQMLRLVGALALAAFALGAAAQSWPVRPVRLVSQFPPGGGTDIIARQLAPRLAEAFGQQFIVENRAGAAGNIAAEFVAKSPPDGYVILVANNTLVINAAMPQKLPFDVIRDFAPIAVVASTPVALAVHPSLPVKAVQELGRLAKAHPGKLTYSSCGTGTAMHLAGELLKQSAKIDMIHVPYKGCGPAVVDGVAGQVPIVFNTITNISAQAKGGRLRILAVASGSRSPVDASIPTIAEAGMKDFDADIWFGFMAPAGTPRDIVNRLNTEFNRIVKSGDVSEKMKTQLFDIRSSTPESFAELIKSDIARWGRVIRDANIKPD